MRTWPSVYESIVAPDSAETKLRTLLGLMSSTTQTASKTSLIAAGGFASLRMLREGGTRARGSRIDVFHRPSRVQRHQELHQRACGPQHLTM